MEHSNEKKKIIIIGEKEKISPRMLENIREHYGDIVIELMSREEFANSGLNDMTDPAITLERLYEIHQPEIPPLEILDPTWTDKDLHAPHNPKKSGKVNNKSLAPAQKQYYKQKRGR